MSWGAPAASICRAAAVLNSWDLTTAVLDFSGNKPVVSGQSFETVVSPLGLSQHITVPDPPPHTHVASTYYDASWLVADSMGHFDVSFNQQINGPSSFASSSGNIYLSTDEDLFLNLSATLTFSSAAADQADFSVFLLTARQGQPSFWSANVLGGTGTFGHPASGSGSFARDNLLLLAGQTYLIQYGADTNMGLNQQPHQPLLANGTIHFDWRPVVPEPSTLALLVAGALRFGPRRSRARPRIEKLLGHDR